MTELDKIRTWLVNARKEQIRLDGLCRQAEDFISGKAVTESQLKPRFRIKKYVRKN